MTTIAFDGRYLAADGRMTRSDIIVSGNVKKSRLITAIIRGEEQEVLVFGAGSWNGIYTVMEWMKVNDVFDTDPDLMRPCFPADPDGDYSRQDLSFITRDGELYCLDAQSRPAPYDAPYADGSGFPFAQMGLTLGQSAVEAVRSAILMDTNSGGDITCFDTEAWEWVDPNDF